MKKDGTAVTLRGACLQFDSREECVVVLDSLDMTVPRGAIYGLLGASGCGKTSLLTCIVGIRKLKSGQIFVLGHEPGTPGCGIPGPRVGYMPQEVALMHDLTTRNIMFYFGRIFGMKSDVVRERLAHLSTLLNLPDTNLYISQLSGGQQRRVSLAVALIHDPELIILDEPTVGLDPLLRQRIWEYLQEITKLSQTTVLLTTHYIEEARQADVIGLMRQGKLLAENSPSVLMERHGCDSMESIFLKLAQAQADKTLPAQESCSLENLTQNKQVDLPPREVTWRSDRQLSKMHALILRNFLGYFRDTSCLACVLLLSVINLATCYLAIGHQPKHISLAVVNDELPRQFNTSLELASKCDTSQLSCQFLDIIESDFRLQYYGDLVSATAEARAGHVHGVIYFGKNFSKALDRRSRQSFLQVSDTTLEQGQISAWLDMTDYSTGLEMRYSLSRAFQIMSQHLLNVTNRKHNFVNYPLRTKQLYTGPNGINDKSLSLYVTSGAILNVVFFLNVVFAFQYILRDLTDGTWNRNRISGVTIVDMLTCHVIAQLFLVLLQTAESITLVIKSFGMYNQGSGILIIAIVILSGLLGITTGFVIAAVCKNYVTASFMCVGVFITSILSCGFLWPLQGMPEPLRAVCELLPLSTMTVSMRNILSKGWGLSHPTVYLGFISAISWSAANFWLTYILLRSHR